jgi:hypothetical protein
VRVRVSHWLWLMVAYHSPMLHYGSDHLLALASVVSGIPSHFIMASAYTGKHRHGLVWGYRYRGINVGRLHIARAVGVLHDRVSLGQRDRSTLVRLPDFPESEHANLSTHDIGPPPLEGRPSIDFVDEPMIGLIFPV